MANFRKVITMTTRTYCKIRLHMQEKNINMSQAVQQAISTEYWLSQQIRQGSRVLIQTDCGCVYEVLLK